MEGVSGGWVRSDSCGRVWDPRIGPRTDRVGPTFPLRSPSSEPIGPPPHEASNQVEVKSLDWVISLRGGGGYCLWWVLLGSEEVWTGSSRGAGDGILGGKGGTLYKVFECPTTSLPPQGLGWSVCGPMVAGRGPCKELFTEYFLPC